MSLSTLGDFWPRKPHSQEADVLEWIRARLEPGDAHPLAPVVRMAAERIGSGAVELVAARLAMGRDQYGELDVHEDRPWSQEASEELADYLVYEACGDLSR